MKRTAIVTAFAASLVFGASAAQAKLPPVPPKSDAEKAAEAQKAASAKAKEAAAMQKAEDKAVASYHMKKGMAAPMPEKMEKK